MVFVPVGQGDDERLERAHWQQSRSGGGHESDDTDLEEGRERAARPLRGTVRE